MAPKVNKLMNQWHCRYCSLEELEHQLTFEIASCQEVDDVKLSLEEFVTLVTGIESIANELASFSSDEVNNCLERTSTLRNRKCKAIKQVKKYEKTCIGDDTSFDSRLVAPAENNPIASFAPVCSTNVNSVATATITASRSSFTTETTSVGMSRNEQRYSNLDQCPSNRVTFQDCNSSVD